MKKLMILAVAAMAMASVVAEPSWAIVNTTGAKGDTSGSFDNYSAYLCTVEAAAEYFGGKSSYSDITAYLRSSQDNYDTGVGAISGGGMTMSAYAYDQGEYSFSLYQQPGTWSASDYIALVTYENADDQYFRVFEGTLANNRLVLDPAAGKGSAGNWTQVVPEPTSGLLLLLGVAGLALRRRRAYNKRRRGNADASNRKILRDCC